MKIVTYGLNENECVGDSVAKHNSNVLALDSGICNLSSTFYSIEDNYFKFFKNYYDNISKFKSAYDEYNNTAILRYKIANATTQTMSSFWNKHEFTVQFNTNISTDYDATIKGNALYTDFISLCSSSWNYLNEKFPANSYINTTTAHVVAVYYSSIQSDLATHVNINPVPFEFSDTERVMNTEFTKPIVSLSGMYIFSFTNSLVPNMWVLAKVLPNVPTILTTPSATTPTPRPTLKYSSSTPPTRPCCGVSVDWQSKKPCCNASLTINYTNPSFGGDLSYLNIFYSTNSNILGYLFGTTVNPSGSITINGLAGGTTYYLTAINTYNVKTQTLTVTTPEYT